MRLEIYNEERFCPVCLLNSRMQSWCQHGGQPTRLKTQFIGVDPHNCFVYKNTKTRLGWGWTLFWLGNLTHSLIYNAHEDRVEYWDIICSCAQAYLRTFTIIFGWRLSFSFILIFKSPHTFFYGLSKLVQYLLIHCVPILFQLCRQQDIDRCHETAVVVFKGGVPNPSNSRRF